jgi:hypothetical protein
VPGKQPKNCPVPRPLQAAGPCDASAENFPSRDQHDRNLTICQRLQFGQLASLLLPLLLLPVRGCLMHHQLLACSHSRI